MAEVRVVWPDGSALYTLDYFDGMRAEEIYALLKEDGYKGRLSIEGRLLTPGRPLMAGCVYTFMEEQPKDDAWYLKHAKIGTPSQLANSVSAMVSALGTLEPVYDMGRTSASAVPLPLANESFRCYLKHRVPDAGDWRFVYNAMEMSKFFDDERQRQVAFEDILLKYLRSSVPNVSFNVTPSPIVGSQRDIKVEALINGEWILVLLVEMKPELGLRGEPSVEAMRYFADHFIARRQAYHWTFFGSCCPVLIIEVVGPNIRVGGAAFFDKPAHEPFTPYLHIHKFLQDRQHLERLSKALASIGPAMSSLVAFYSKLSQQQQPGSAGRVRDPSISWPDFIRDEHAQGASVTQYWRPKIQASQLRQQHVGRENLLLFSLLRPASKRIVKFCQRYGVEVHAKWAALGYAPPFSCKQLEDGGNWLVVDMEYYTETDGWRPLTALDPVLFDSNARTTDSINMYRLSPPAWEVCKAAVKSAYVELHSAHPEYVHGDLRRQNILYNVRSGKVAFIDFDWAGVDGCDLYPLFINPFIAWPPGVGSCQPMRCSHDVAILNMELALNL